MRFFKNAYVSKSERRGVLFVSLLMLILSVYRFNKVNRISEPDALLLELAEQVESRKGPLKKTKARTQSDGIEQFTAMNPNEMSVADWAHLGFSDKQARAIVNYGLAIGGFWSESDLAGSFVIDEEDIMRLGPYMKYGEKPERKGGEKIGEGGHRIFSSPDSFKIEENDDPIIWMDLNGADEDRLDSIPGIGNYYARIIIRYRDKLGGFVSIEQLEEAGIRTTLVDSISAYVYLDSTGVNRVNLNGASYHELKKHPYISNHLALKIVESRYNQGTFVEVGELLKRGLVNESIYSKLAPYLNIEEKPIK